MNRLKRTSLIRLGFIYGVLILLTYLAGYAYWENQSASFWMCRAIDGPTYSGSCPLKPDGPMGVLLFVLIPIAVSILFASTVFGMSRIKRKRINQKSKNWGEL